MVISATPAFQDHTKRFAYFVGRRCRQAAISDVAKELALDWHTVKGLEIQYMKAQLAGAGTPGPLVIGIDEIAIRAPVALEAKTPLIARSQL